MAHEHEGPVKDPQPLLRADTAPNYTLQVDISSTPIHQDTRSWFFLFRSATSPFYPKYSCPTRLPFHPPHDSLLTLTAFYPSVCTSPLVNNIHLNHLLFTFYPQPGSQLSLPIPHFPSSSTTTQANLHTGRFPSTSPISTQGLDLPHTSYYTCNNFILSKSLHASHSATGQVSFTETSRASHTKSTLTTSTAFKHFTLSVKHTDLSFATNTKPATLNSQPTSLKHFS